MLTRIRRTFRRIIFGKPISHEEQRAAQAGMYRDQRVVQQQAARQVGAGAPFL